MFQDHVIIIGFGVPGRAAAEALDVAGVRYVVVELNRITVARLDKTFARCIEGSGTDEAVLHSANVDGARLVIVAIPDERVALQIVEVVRRLNASVRLIVRCHYTSTGLEALRLGANQIVVAEQAVARELAALIPRALAAQDVT